MNTITLRDLFEAVDTNSKSDSETVAAIVHLVNSGRVRFTGNLRGARFDLNVPKHRAA